MGDSEGAPVSLSCSQHSRESGEPLAATATTAQTFLVLEHPGPWGRQALQDADLPGGLGAHLASASANTGTTVLLARRPGRERTPTTEQISFWLAHTSPGGTRMRRGSVSAAHLRHADFVAMAHGQLPAWGERHHDPMLLVCTNGKRDVCCATRGREITTALTTSPQFADVADAIWESSHLGGHRFAATSLLLPHGSMHARLDADSAASIVRAARVGAVHGHGYRGRTTWRPWLQAAEIAVRTEADLYEIDALDVLRVLPHPEDGERAIPCPPGSGPVDAPDEVIAEVRHRDGRAWRVHLESAWHSPSLQSCGGQMEPSRFWRARTVEPTATWLP